MTKCLRQPLPFKDLGARTVVADFDGGAITADGGALLLREVADKIGLFDQLDAAIPDPRHPQLIKHDQRAMLVQRVTAIALGYEDLNDHQNLRVDPMMQISVGTAPEPNTPLASPPTLCRLENRVDRAALVKLSKVLIDQFIASRPTPPEHLTLDFDATDAPVHGNQEGRFYHGFYDHYCYFPLYVFCGDDILAAYLRPSKIDGAKHSRAILRLIVKELRRVWPEVRVTVRADSGFCRRRFLRWCDHNGVGYVVGLAKNPKLAGFAIDQIEAARRGFDRTKLPQRVFGSFSYAAGTWDRSRRVIVKAEHNAQGANPRFIVTNVPGDPRELYEDVYCQRGEAENRIKEQQLDLFAARVSCSAFLSNQFRLLLSAAAHILIQAFRRATLAGTDLARAQAGTIRLKLFKVAARVVVSARRIVFHLSSSYPYRDIFVAVHRILTSSPNSPSAAPAPS